MFTLIFEVFKKASRGILAKYCGLKITQCNLEGDEKKLDTHFGPEFFVLEQCFTLNSQNDF